MCLLIALLIYILISSFVHHDIISPDHPPPHLLPPVSPTHHSSPLQHHSVQHPGTSHIIQAQIHNSHEVIPREGEAGDKGQRRRNQIIR